MPKVNIFFRRNDNYHTLHKYTKICANWMRASCWFLCLKKSAITFGEGCMSVHHWFYNHRKPRVTMMPTLSSLVAPEVVITTSGATSDDKVGIITTLAFSIILPSSRSRRFINDDIPYDMILLTYVLISHVDIYDVTTILEQRKRVVPRTLRKYGWLLQTFFIFS